MDPATAALLAGGMGAAIIRNPPLLAIEVRRNHLLLALGLCRTALMLALGVCGTPSWLALGLGCAAVATAAAAAILQVLEADLVGAIATPFESALDVRGVSVEQDRAHSHSTGQLVQGQGALAVCVACDQLVRLFAHHVFCLSLSPDIHRPGKHFDMIKVSLCYCVVNEIRSLLYWIFITTTKDI